MAEKSENKKYMQAIELAEAGEYAGAMEIMDTYIAENQADAEAWNDAGTILFCRGETDKSISYFKKSIALDKDNAQAIWNLAESNLAAGNLNEVVSLFDSLNRCNIFCVDLVNRVANQYLNQNQIGNAIDMLYFSLQVQPEQTVLLNMIEVIKLSRPKIAIAGDINKTVAEYIANHFTVNWIKNHDQDKLSDAVKASDAVVIPQDDFSLRAIISDIDNGCKIVEISNNTTKYDLESLDCKNKGRGKNIVSLGPVTKDRNPMYLLQCIQKLHYLDRDFKLYFAGECKDTELMNYLENMIAEMDLEGVVYFDRYPQDIRAYLGDKHYIAYSAIDGSGIADVFMAMASGLRPIVHTFPGSRDYLPSGMLFRIAEEFCSQATDQNYNPSDYRYLALNSDFAKSNLRYIAKELDTIPKRHNPVHSEISENLTEVSESILYEDSASQVQKITKVVSPEFESSDMHQLREAVSDKKSRDVVKHFVWNDTDFDSSRDGQNEDNVTQSTQDASSDDIANNDTLKLQSE